MKKIGVQCPLQKVVKHLLWRDVSGFSTHSLEEFVQGAVVVTTCQLVYILGKKNDINTYILIVLRELISSVTFQLLQNHRYPKTPFSR